MKDNNKALFSMMHGGADGAPEDAGMAQTDNLCAYEARVCFCHEGKHLSDNLPVSLKAHYHRHLSHLAHLS